MSYYENIKTIKATSLLEFGEIKSNLLQKFRTQTGQVAGFLIKEIGLEENGQLQISEIYDCSDGGQVLLGAVQVLPGIDYCGGLFSSGAISTTDPLDETRKFYKIDYTL